MCRDLIGIDISTKEGLERARDLGIFDTLSVPFVKDAVEIIENLLRCIRKADRYHLRFPDIILLKNRRSFSEISIRQIPIPTVLSSPSIPYRSDQTTFPVTSRTP